MRCLTVSRFLCCLNLKVGAIFVGVVGILLSIWELYDGKMFGNIDRVMRILAKIPSSKKKRSAFNPAFALIIASAVWLYGIRVKRTLFLLPLFVLTAVALAFTFLYPFMVLWLVQFRPESETARDFSNTDFIITESLLYITEYVITTYFCMVEYSFYNEIDDAEDRAMVMY